jgi:GT2 family glycosyltransferase
MSRVGGDRAPAPAAAGAAGVVLPTPAAPRASIVVSAWRSAPRLVRCLASIAALRTDVAYEVVLALNEPSPQLLGELAHRVTGAQVVAIPVNLGFGRACNLGVARSRGELVVVVNDDLEVAEGWLDKLVEVADADPGAGAVGSANYNPDGTLQELGAIVWADGLTTMVDDDVVRRLGDRLDFSKPRRVDYCGAASLLVRRSTWDVLGGFDPRYYPAYFEDVDLCLRIAQLGQSVVIQPQSRLVHHRGSSSTLAFREFVSARNRRLFLERWGELLAHHEPFAPEDPDAVVRALERAASAEPLGAGAASAPGATRSWGPAPATGSPRASSAPPAGAPSVLSAEEERDALRDQIELMAAYAEHLEERGRQLAGQVSSWRTTALSRWAKVLATDTELERVRDDLAELRHASAVEASRLRSAVEHFQRERAELRQQIADLHASTSWRLTRPLRWLGSLGRGAGGRR